MYRFIRPMDSKLGVSHIAIYSKHGIVLYFPHQRRFEGVGWSGVALGMEWDGMGWEWMGWIDLNCISSGIFDNMMRNRKKGKLYIADDC